MYSKAVGQLTISSSKSKSLQGPNTGGFSGSGRVCPDGLWMEVPDTTTDEARPWYPTGRWSLGRVGGGGGGKEGGEGEVNTLHVSLVSLVPTSLA